jgi:hypothetical protein
MDGNALEQLYSTLIQQYKHKPSAPHNFKLKVISFELVLDHCCKNGWETGGE